MSRDLYLGIVIAAIAAAIVIAGEQACRVIAWGMRELF